MPEIKTRQHKVQPVVNTAQRQMQRNFVRSRAEQAAHQQSEQSDSPSNYAEDKISRTAEDTVRDVGTFARESARTIRQRGDMPVSGDSVPTCDSSPAGSAAMEYSENPAVRRQIAEASHRHGQVRQTAIEPPESQSRVVQAPRPVRTREQQEAVSSAVEAPLSPAQQQAARKTAAKLAKSAAEAAKALYAAIIASGAASILVIVIVILIGCGAAIFGSQDESTETLPLSAEVEAYEPVIRKYAKQYGIPDYVPLIQAVMMQESGGRGNDPMQASECRYNTQYPRTPGGITDPEYSIAVGIQNLADCLQVAGAESPIDLEHIQLALQGYNFGSGYITWALQKYGEYSRANAIEFSMKMAEQMGWNSYGDKQYVPHVLRYYPIGKVFYTPEDGDAIVDVALSQVGNVGGEPYWSWYGFTNHVEWCACFVSWCADQCGYLDSGTYPKFSGCIFGMQWFQQRGLWLDGSTEPTPGMLIFFDWATQDGVPDHVGIVEKAENGMVYTIEGNSRDMCRQKQYSLGSTVILGYGMPAN